MNDRAYKNGHERDLGAGVIETDDEPPVRRRSHECPTCSRCGSNDSSTRVSHPEGEWWCSVCNTLYSASDHEWHVLAKVRKEAIERRAQTEQSKEAS